MRKSLALAAVLAASALSLAAAPASASSGYAPAVHPSAVTADSNLFKGVQLCDRDDGLCMSGHDGEDGPITTQPFATGVAETVNIIQAAECGGTVVYRPNFNPPVFCPFADHALDNQYKGDNLVVIQNADNHMTYRPGDLDGTVVEATGGDGEVWVQDGNLRLGTTVIGATLINVQNRAKPGNNSYAACAGVGQGSFVVVSVPSLEACFWAVHS